VSLFRALKLSRTAGEDNVSSVPGDFKKYTGKQIIKAIKEHPGQSRRECLPGQAGPVQAGFVTREEDWQYSIARDFCGSKGLIELSYS